MKTTIYIFLFAAALGAASCANTRKTTKANPSNPQYEPLRNKADGGYNNTPGSQNREVGQDINADRKIDIKDDK